MSDKAKKYAEELESGSIPEELAALRSIGTALKSNPEKYKELRTALLSASNDTERMSVLNGFMICEDQLRTLSFGSATPQAIGITTTIIIITIVTWPGTAH